MKIIGSVALACALLAAAVYLVAARYGFSSDSIYRGVGVALGAIISCGLVAVAVARGSFARARWDLVLPIAGAFAVYTALKP